MSVLYIEPFSGLSGDMFLSALTDITGQYETLKSLPSMLSLSDAEIEINEVNKNGIVCKHVKVKDNSQRRHGRKFQEILTIIEKSYLDDDSKTIAKAIFELLGKAESKVHNKPLDTIHLHEVSGVDSIIDIAGTALMLSKLNIDKVYATPVCIGFGFVDTQHGKLPVPAPATMELLKGIPVFQGEEKGERTTPTGAAILKYLNPLFPVPVLKIQKTSYGPGEKDFEEPNVLRISLAEVQHTGKFIQLETNIDDMSPELLGQDFQEGLLQNGAIDYYLMPVQMKKARNGWLLSCLVKEENLNTLADYILENTSSIGVRFFTVNRKILSREIVKVSTRYGLVRIKLITTPAGLTRKTVEYQDLLKLSNQHNISMVKLKNELLKDIN